MIILGSITHFSEVIVLKFSRVNYADESVTKSHLERRGAEGGLRIPCPVHCWPKYFVSVNFNCKT